jgi:hypothetical protein
MTLKDVPGGTPATAGEDARAPRDREMAIEIAKPETRRVSPGGFDSTANSTANSTAKG